MNAVATAEMWRVPEVLARLGGIPAERVLLRWPQGEVTEEEWAKLDGAYELVDGFLVEKTMGVFETRLGIVLAALLEHYAAEHDLGFILAETGPTRVEGQIRMPDVAFFPWSRVADHRVPRVPVLEFAPDLAVEVMSPSNTAGEIERKRRECFAAGTRLVWEVEPELRVVRVYTDADTFHAVTLSDELTGEPVLPGFRLPLRELFERAEGRS